MCILTFHGGREAVVYNLTKAEELLGMHFLQAMTYYYYDTRQQEVQ